MTSGSLADSRRRSTRLHVWIAILIAVALSLFVTLNVSNASADSSTTVVVHSGDANWSTADTRSGGSVAFVAGPTGAPLGTGSLQLNTTEGSDANQAKAQLFNTSYVGTHISDLTTLSYSEYHSSSSTAAYPAQHASINIEITDPDLGFTTLVYEPYEQAGFSPTDDTWTPWNTLDGVWWSTHALPGHSNKFDTTPWSTILADYPNATITGGIGLNVGSGWHGLANNNVDALAIGVNGATTVYDFEPTPAPPTNNVVMSALDSSGNPLSGVAITYQGSYYLNLGTTDATGTVSAHLPSGTYTFYAKYNGTTSTYGPVSVTTDAVTSHTFQTINAQVQLHTCSAQGLSGAHVLYQAGSYTYPLGDTDATGVASKEFFPGSYPVTLSYAGGSAQATVDFGSTNPYTFTTTPVALLNPGHFTYNVAGGYVYNYTGGTTAQLLPDTYIFHGNGTSFNVDVPSNCSGFTGGVVRLVDHAGNGLSGGTASYYAGGWHSITGSTDANGNLVFSAPSNFTYISMNYKGGIAQQSRTQLDTSHYTFQTVLATVKLEDADGNALDTGSVSFYAGGWQTFGSGATSGGQVTMELLPTSYSFAMIYNHSRQQLDGQNLATNPVVIFQTGRLSLYYSGSIQWYGGGWTTFAKPTMEFLPGTITYYFDGYGCQAPVTIASGDHLVKSAVVATLSDHAGTKVAGGDASAYVGGWQSIGTTNSYGVACNLFDGQLGNVSVAMVYNGTRQQITQNQPTNSVYAFQAGQITIELKNSTGALIDTGAVSYYAGGWHNLGGTSGGKVAVDVLPGTYAFAMVYNGERNQVSQAVTNGSTVVFQTVNANVKLLDSTGAGIEGGNATYYAGGWHTFGTTDASGNAYQEMLPGSYSFAMGYNGMRQQLNGQDVSSPIVFQTTGVTVQLQRSTGANPPLAGGDASYYAGGWHTIGTTDNNGQMTIEMLPGSYSFAMVFNGTRSQMNGVEISGTTDNVTFQTVLVSVLLRTPDGHSPVTDVDASASYYAGGWHTVTTNNGYAPFLMLPGNYSFAMVYKGTREQINNVTVSGATTNVEFLTTQVHSDSGNATSYYAGGWQPFTQDMYLLPGNYAFRFNDGTPQTQETLTGGTTSNIH
jgi:hypothetical protein